MYQTWIQKKAVENKNFVTIHWIDNFNKLYFKQHKLNGDVDKPYVAFNLTGYGQIVTFDSAPYLNYSRAKKNFLTKEFFETIDLDTFLKNHLFKRDPTKSCLVEKYRCFNYPLKPENRLTEEETEFVKKISTTKNFLPTNIFPWNVSAADGLRKTIEFFIKEQIGNRKYQILLLDVSLYDRFLKVFNFKFYYS